MRPLVLLLLLAMGGGCRCSRLVARVRVWNRCRGHRAGNRFPSKGLLRHGSHALKTARTGFWFVGKHSSGWHGIAKQPCSRGFPHAVSAACFALSPCTVATSVCAALCSSRG